MEPEEEETHGNDIHTQTQSSGKENKMRMTDTPSFHFSTCVALISY